MQIDEYIEHRLNEQLSWFSRKSASCQREYKRLRYIETVCILLLPIAGLLPIPGDARSLLLVILGAIAAYVRFFAELNSCHDLWLRYRLAAEMLKREKLLHATHAGAYRGDDRDDVLIVNVERIISAANNEWAQLMREEASPPHSTGS